MIRKLSYGKRAVRTAHASRDHNGREQCNIDGKKQNHDSDHGKNIPPEETLHRIHDCTSFRLRR